jgi:hypothetical protein
MLHRLPLASLEVSLLALKASLLALTLSLLALALSLVASTLSLLALFKSIDHNKITWTMPKLLPFSLMEFLAIFAEVKGNFGMNDHL